MSCSKSNNTQCNVCIPGYYVDQTTAQCSSCAFAPRCFYCVPNQPTVCIICAPGFYLNSNSTCSACPLFCQTCTSATVCLTLFTPIGYTIVVANNQSVLGVCDPGCYQCSSIIPSSCTVCIPGFYLSTIPSNGNLGVCVPCSTNCYYCATNAPTTCTACFAGAYLVTANNTCVSCVFPCITCTSGTPTSCTSCPSGYVLFANFTCSQLSTNTNSTCGQNCGTCIQTLNSNPICINCLAGFVLANGLCVLCPNACSVCTLNQNTLTNNQPVCTACNIGYYLNTQSLLCQSCAAGCGACFNSTICQSCLNGYSLTSTYQCVMRCVYPCSTCPATNASQCNSCVSGFTYSSSIKGCVSNVNTCNNGSSCTVCPFGYNLLTQGSSQTCVICDAASNCARCSPTNRAQCTSCLYGTYLNNGLCQTCSVGCSICLGGNTCFRCYNGYVALLPATLVTGSSNSPLLVNEVGTNNIVFQPITCVQCVSPCVNCISSSSSCLSCITGYTILGTQCVSNYNFGATVVFSTNPTNFVQNYYNLLANISATVGQQINTIAVISIQYGSATVSFIVSTPNAEGSSAAATQQTNLQNLFVNNQTVAGLPVSTSTVVVNGGTSSSSSSSSSTNTTLILAIVIPIAALIIIATIVIICCIRKRKQQLNTL